MMTSNRSAAFVVASAGAALVGTIAVASLPVATGLAVASVLFAVLAYVAFAAQSRRFEDESRLVYRPVYVRSRNVHRRVSSFED